MTERALISGEDARRYVTEEIGDGMISAVSSETEDLYEDDLPQDDETFTLGLQALIHQLPYDLELDPELIGDKAEEATARGVVKAWWKVGLTGKWEVQVNWNKTEWEGKIPPGYMRILWHDSEVAILGPWLTVRTCWFCKLKGLLDLPGGGKIGHVVPGVPCPRCGTLDWHSKLVTPEDFMQSCAIVVADETGADDKRYQLFAGRTA